MVKRPAEGLLGGGLLRLGWDSLFTLFFYLHDERGGLLARSEEGRRTLCFTGGEDSLRKAAISAESIGYGVRLGEKARHGPA
jgi:hypothetical protein